MYSHVGNVEKFLNFTTSFGHKRSNQNIFLAKKIDLIFLTKLPCKKHSFLIELDM